jgi:chorismate mutase
MSDSLVELRGRIDECDNKLVHLINERLKMCQDVGQFKYANNIEIRDHNRERKVIKKVLSENEGPCPPDVLEKVFRYLIEAAVLLEEKGFSASNTKKY